MRHDASSSAAGEPAWPGWKRIGFRFLTVNFWLIVAPFPLSYVPWLGSKLQQGVTWFWQQSALFVGHRLLGIEEEISLAATGSGDTTYHYLRLLAILLLAILVTAAWSWLGRRRPHYATGARWLTLVTALALASAMVNYGLMKVFPTQFSPPPLHRLLETWGTSSPMGVAWTFFGLVPAYTVFLGLAELVPGVLLLFARTRLLGACLATAVLLNIVMVNLAFDVPVKINSILFLAMAVALVLCDARRLVVFFSGGAVAAPVRRPLFTSRPWRAVAIVLLVAVVGQTVWQRASRGHAFYSLYGGGRTLPAIWGIHDVESFVVDGETRPPLVTDEVRWRALVIDRALSSRRFGRLRPGRISIQGMDGAIRHLTVELDEDAATITLLPKGQSSVAAAREAGVALADVLRYERFEPGRLRVRGTFDGHALEVTLRERDLEEMHLISRGFRWINEAPFNR